MNEPAAGVAYVPKSSKSTSSQRVQACSVVSKVKYDQASSKSKAKMDRRAYEKEKKQRHHLEHVVVPSKYPKCTIEEVNDSIVFADGGDIANPRIQPKPNNPKDKPVTILQICNGDLYVPKNHMNDPEKGLTIFVEGGGNKPFILVPRFHALKRNALHNNMEKSVLLFEAFEEVEKVNTSEERGSEKEIMLDEGRRHICVGSKVYRAAKGVNEYHHSMAKIDEKYQEIIYRYIKGVEQSFNEWVDTDIVRQVHDAMQLVSAKAFAIPKIGKTQIYSAFASGMNAYLNAHTDSDFTLGAVSLHTKHSYQYDDGILGYFVFPLRSLAVPLRQGDLLFFDSKEPHMLSSRCKNEDNIYAVSLYLKSNIMGLNNNSLPLSSDQQYMATMYNQYNSAHKKVFPSKQKR